MANTVVNFPIASAPASVAPAPGVKTSSPNVVNFPIAGQDSTPTPTPAPTPAPTPGVNKFGSDVSSHPFNPLNTNNQAVQTKTPTPAPSTASQFMPALAD